MAQGRVKIGVGFDVDKSGLNELKSSLVNLQNATKLDVFNVSTTKKELAEIQQSANQVAAALNKSYNAKLGTYNIEAFKKEINATTGGLSALQQQWSKVATGERAFRNLANSLTSTNLELKETHSLLDSMGTTLMNTIKWSIASTAVNTVTGSIQKAWSFTKQLDESLTNIMIVTEKSSDQMAAFARQANTAAKALGASTKAYSDAALIYYQQGLGDDEVISRTNTTLKAANVTGQNAAQVSEQLTAVWNGYKVAAQETELYVDKLSAVAATTAADLEELSTGMSKVSSAANTMGVDIDQLNAQLATVISVTRQAPESVGTAFKTIFARMGDIEAGLDTETTLGEYTSKMEAMGFNVLNANNQLRDQGEVIEEIGAKWKSLSREQQIALAQTMAGTRQYNNLLALFDNWDMYEKALQTSANAAGTLSQQNEEYLDSLEAKMQQLTTTAEDLYLSLFDSDSFKDGIDLLTKGVDVLGQFVESVGGGGTVLLSLGTIITRVFSKQLSQSIATTATNFINAKQNAEALAITMQNIKDLDKLDMDEATKSILNMKERLVSLRQAGLLTNEQFEDLTRQIKDFSDAADEASIIKERAQQLDNTLRFNPEVIRRAQTEAAAPKGIVKNYSLQKVIEESEKQFAETGNPNAQGNAAFHGLERQLDTLVGKATAFKTILNEASSTKLEDSDIIKFQTALAGDDGWFALSQSQLVSEDTVAKIKAVSKEMAALSTELKTLAPEDEKRAEVQAEYIRMMKQELTPLWKKAEQEATKTAEEIRKTGEEIANGALHASDVTVKGIQDTFKKIDLTQAIQKVVNFTSSLGAAASALNILGNIDDIWSNEDLSAGEKVTQTIMNVTSAAGMLLPLIQGITAWRAKSVAAIEADNIATSKKIALESIEKSLTVAGNDAAMKKYIYLNLIKDTYTDLDDAERKRLLNLLNEKKALDANTEAEIKNSLAKKQAVNGNTTPTNKDIFSNKIGSVKKNFGEGMQGFKGTWSKIKGFNAIGAAKAGVASAGGGTAASVGAGIAAALPYAAVLAAIVTSIAVSWSNASKKNKEEQRAWEQTSVAAESAQKRLNKVNAEWDNLESSLDALDNGVKTLDELTEGTVEWQKALSDVNNQVIELLNKYPELAQYVTRDASTGQLGISATGQAIVQQKQLEELQSAQASSALANLEAASAKQDKLLNDLIDQNSNGDILGPAAMAGSMAAAGAIIGTVVPGIGNAIGAIVGAGIGAIAGIATAAATSSAIDAAEEAEKKALQENPTFIAAMEAYVTHGDKIYESEEALSKALGDVENKDIELIKELAENSKQTKALAEAYTQAKAVEYDQKVALGASILGENAAKGAQYIAGDQASLIPEEFKARLREELSGGNSKDEALAREWARLTGISSEVTSIDTKGKNKVVIKNAKGETLGEYDAESLITEVTQLRWQEGQKAKGNAEAVSTWQNISGLTNDQEIENALSEVITGAAGASFESLTKTDFEKLQNIPEDKLKTALEQYAKAVDEESSVIFERFNKSVKASGELWARMAESMPQAVGALFTSLTDGLDFPASEGQKFANIVATLANNFGAANATDFLNIIAGLGESDQEDLISALGRVNWSDIAAKDIASTVTNLIDNADIEIGLAEQDKIIRALELVVNNRYSIEAQQEQYRNLQDLLKDVADDGRISAEKYAELSDLQKSYFTIMADGSAILIKNATDWYNLNKANRIDETKNTLIGAATKVDAAELAYSKSLQGKADLQKEKGVLQAQINAYSGAILENDVVKKYLSSLGYNYESIEHIATTAGTEGMSIKDYILSLDSSENAETKKIQDGLIQYLQDSGYDQYQKNIASLNALNAKINNYQIDNSQEAANEELLKIIEQSIIEAGSDAEWENILTTIQTEDQAAYNRIKRAWSELDFDKIHSEQLRAQSIGALTNETYQRWAREDQNGLNRLVDIEKRNRALAQEEKQLQKLNDEYNSLNDADKLQNLNDQIILSTQALEDQKAIVADETQASKDVIESMLANQEILKDNATLAAALAEVQSGEITYATMEAIRALLHSENVDETWINTLLAEYETYFNIAEEGEDKIAAKQRENRELILQSFEESTVQLNDYYDTQIGYLETSISLLDHQVELNKLINGEDSVSKDQLEDIAEARKSIYEQRKAELADWSQSYSELAADDISAEANEVRNQYYQAAQDAAQAEIEMIQAYTDANTAAVTQSIEEILGTSLSALAKLKEEADWTAASSARYLNDREKSYSFDTMKYQFESTAKEYESLEIRELINDAYEKELAALEARDALTEADFERAEKRLELLKAQIALERAEQDMSNMRLVRGANGEYSYQFVADRSKIAEKEQAKRDAEKAVYDAEVAAVQDVSNQAYDSFNALTDYLKEAVSDGVIDADEQRRITKMQEDAERSVESILPTLNELGETLGYNTKDNPDWWKTVDLSEHGVPTEFIAGLLKNINEAGELSNLDNLSAEGLEEKLKTFNGDIKWEDIINAAKQDAENAAKNMVDPEYLRGQIDRVVASLDALAHGEEIPEWVWNSENDAASGAPKAPAANGLKPVIPRLDGTQVENMIRNGVATTVSTFEGVNNRVHLTPVDAGNGVIEQKVEIVANFPDATDRDEIKAAFDDLIGLAVQHANQNVKGK